MVLDSYYPDIVDSGVHTSSGESSRLSWGSVQQSQFPSFRSGSQLSTTTASSQESYSALLQANKKLEQEKLILEARLGALEQAYTLLAQSLKPVTPNAISDIPVHSSLAKSEEVLIPLNMLPAAEREHYPLVKFWHRHEWNSAENNQVAHIGAGAHGKARAAQGENVTLRFIEDGDGNIIDGFRATAMRRFARELWASLNSIGKAPKTWGKVDAAVAAQYRNEMERKFSELRLCDSNWKTDFIATLNYPSWYNNHVEKEEHLKRSSVDPPPDAKRPRASTDCPVSSIHSHSHASHKKRTKHRARVPFKEIDSPLPEVAIFPLTEAPGDDSRDPPAELLGFRDPETHIRSRVKNPLFSVPSAIPNLEKNNQVLPHILTIPNEVVNEMEIPMATTKVVGIPAATTTMMEQTTVNQTATTTGEDQMVAMTAVGQPAPGTAINLAAAALDWIAPEISNHTSPTTIPPIDVPGAVDAPATTAPVNAPATPDSPAIVDAPATTPSDAPVAVDVPATTAPVNAPATPDSPAAVDAPATTPSDAPVAVDASATTVPVDPATTPPDAPATTALPDAPAMTAPVDFLATMATVPPIVGSGIGKKAGIMRPNPHSTTARNLCALDWKERNPYGSTTDFKLYYDHLSIEQKKMWKNREASMKAGPGHA